MPLESDSLTVATTFQSDLSGGLTWHMGIRSQNAFRIHVATKSIFIADVPHQCRNAMYTGQLLTVSWCFWQFIALIWTESVFFSCPEQRFYRQLLGMCGALRLGPDNLGSIYTPGWDCKVRVMTNFRAFVEPRGVEGMQTYWNVLLFSGQSENHACHHIFSVMVGILKGKSEITMTCSGGNHTANCVSVATITMPLGKAERKVLLRRGTFLSLLH